VPWKEWPSWAVPLAHHAAGGIADAFVDVVCGPVKDQNLYGRHGGGADCRTATAGGRLKAVLSWRIARGEGEAAGEFRGTAN
jgi:hypothetical protein